MTLDRKTILKNRREMAKRIELGSKKTVGYFYLKPIKKKRKNKR